MKQNNKPPIVFGTIIIDKLHQFFGKADPTAAVVVDCYSQEDDDQEVRIDHFRGSFEVKYSDLRDDSKWLVLERRIDTSKPIHGQLDDAVKDYLQSR